MKEFYSIGEVSKIMGISVQTLRYYANIHLLEPVRINEETGYRYYSANQFHLIDRIKYLQKLGFPLDEIQDILVNNNIQKLLESLSRHKEECEKQIHHLTDTIDSIEWYKDYFAYAKKDQIGSLADIKHFPVRYAVVVPVSSYEDRPDAHVRLTALRHNTYKGLSYKRQYFLTLNFDALLQNQISPHSLGMFIKSKPAEETANIMEIPEGNYYCFKARIFSGDWNPYIVNMFFSGEEKPKLVLASEYENNLHEYSLCPYEVQILIAEKSPSSFSL